MNALDMSLFDTIKCDYALPLPDFTKEDMEELGKIDWTEQEFQTKSLDNLMSTYSIEEDGRMYVEKNEFIEDSDSDTGFSSKSLGIERVDYTGEIEFYNILMGKNYDYWIEFKALFWKGDLKEMDLVKFDKENNEERVKAQRDFQKEINNFQDKKHKWWFSLYALYRRCLSGVMRAFRWLAEKVAHASWVIERWMP
tara:strand:+ start:167 stop:754 length:588 start_codon:yes stop_codon:yes gene_type:complete